MQTAKIIVVRIVTADIRDPEYWKQSVYNDLQQGIAHFGLSSLADADLEQLKLRLTKVQWNQLTEAERNSWSSCAFLLDLRPGDYLIYLDLPSYGCHSVSRITGKYCFSDTWDPGKVGGYRHKLDCEFIDVIDQNQPILARAVETCRNKGLWSRLAPLPEFNSFFKKTATSTIGTETQEFDSESTSRKIKAREIVSDLRSSMTTAELLKKYQLSNSALIKIVQKLVAAGALRSTEACVRFPNYDSTECFLPLREVEREYLEIALPVHVSADPQRRGIVRNISEKGMGIAGIYVDVDESVGLTIPSNDFCALEDIRFETTCRWVRRKKDYWTGGFEITRIDDAHLELLRKLISFLSCCELP